MNNTLKVLTLGLGFTHTACAGTNTPHHNFIPSAKENIITSPTNAHLSKPDSRPIPTQDQKSIVLSEDEPLNDIAKNTSTDVFLQCGINPTSTDICFDEKTALFGEFQERYKICQEALNPAIEGIQKATAEMGCIAHILVFHPDRKEDAVQISKCVQNKLDCLLNTISQK